MSVNQVHQSTEERENVTHNHILFGAPGTGKSFTLNKNLEVLLGDDKDTHYERVTFHPDYSYAHFVGTYKPVMVERASSQGKDEDVLQVVSVLKNKLLTAQKKYDVLYGLFNDGKFKDGLWRIPLLVGIAMGKDGDNETSKSKDDDGKASAVIIKTQNGNNSDDSVGINHGKRISKYVQFVSDQPENTSNIAYEYVPGPFMRVYVNALRSAMSENPKPHVLVIEEINRANVAAIFGDIFQLLDRNDEGASVYPIQASEDIKQYLAKELGGKPEAYKTLCIPKNMYIWATMNSADQGVFPMDTAFKRRWDFTYLDIDNGEEQIAGKYVQLSESQKIEWNKLRKAINQFLIEEKINEDKLLGPYFLSKNIVVPEGTDINREDFIRVFKNKVLMYLFEDAARQKRQTLFAGCGGKALQYSAICKAFDEKGVHIFHDSIKAAMGLSSL